MHALVFEVLPTQEGRARYFEVAASLRPILDENKGLLFIDRYERLVRPGLIVSHSLWGDEASLARWRSNREHYAAQCLGRRQLFQDYRLRIGKVVDEWTPIAGLSSQSEEGAYNDPDLVAPRYLITVASTGEPVSIDGLEPFRSVYREQEFIAIGPFKARSELARYISQVTACPNVTSLRVVLVARDYGMNDRDEAPQYLARGSDI